MFGLLAAGASLLGGVLGSRAADRAAEAQQRAAEAQLRYARETRDLMRGDLQPWRQQGQNALNMYAAELMGTGPTQFQQTQDYRFGLDQGTDAVQASAAARGGLYSGATLQALNQYGQDYGSQRRGQWMNQLAGLSGQGQSAAAGQGAAAMQALGYSNNALSAMGNAQAAGSIGGANAWQDAIGNAVGAWGYMQGQGGGQGGLGSLFSGGQNWLGGW